MDGEKTTHLLLTARKRTPADESMSRAMHIMRPAMVRFEHVIAGKSYLQTSVFGCWNEVDDQAETNNVPLLAMFDLRVHQQEILLEDCGVSRPQIYRGYIDTGHTSIIVMPQSSDFQQSAIPSHQ